MHPIARRSCAQILLRDPNWNVGDGAIRCAVVAVVYEPPIERMELLILLAPGAGAPSSHPWMQNWKRRLSEIGEVETFDYAYMRESRKRPDPLPKLIAAHREALSDARKRHSAESTILIGKSMGGRVACHLSLEQMVDRVNCLVYPLYEMGDLIQVRDDVLLVVNTPMLVAQGTRDALCPLDVRDRTRNE